MSINSHRLNVRIWEKGVNERGLYEQRLRRWREDRERPYALMHFTDRPEPYDRAATGELNVSALGFSSGRQTTWGDRSRWSVENRLPHLIRELELQAAEAEERRLQHEREQAERLREWEQAMEDARRQLIEHHRRELLLSRVQAWEEAERIRRYCNAVEERYGATTIAEHSEAGEWLAFAGGLADQAQEIPGFPPDPEISPSALSPFLNGLSPYGPRGW